MRRWFVLMLLSLPACGSPASGLEDAGPRDAHVPDAGAWRASELRLSSTADPSPAATRQNVTQWNTSHGIATDERGGVHAVWVELATNAVEYAADLPDPVDVAALPAGRIVHRRSLDGGLTWEPPRELTPLSAGTDSANVATAGDDVYAVWRATEGARLGVYLARSADRGATWGAPVALSDAPASVSASPPSLAVSRVGAETLVRVVWADARPRTGPGGTFSVKEVYLSSSDDGGASFSAVRPISTAEGRSSWTPSVALSGRSLHVAWTDERDDIGECTRDGNPCREEEYYRRSLDGGATWDAEMRLTVDPAESWAPSIAAWDDSVHVVYLDRRTGAFRNYHRRSLDGGATWEAEALLPAAPEFANAARPNVAARAGAVLIAWFGFTDFEADVYAASSADDGASWSGALDLTATSPGAARLPHVALDASGRGHVVFYDTRHSDGAGPRVEVYYASLSR